MARSAWQCQPADEWVAVSKSVLTLLVIGIVGAILLSLVMRHLVEVATETDRSPYTAAVESRLGSRRVGRVSIEEQVEADHVRLTVRATVLVGLNKRPLAESAGQEVWLGAMRKGARLDEVVVVMSDDDHGKAETFVVAAPTTRR